MWLSRLQHVMEDAAQQYKYVSCKPIISAKQAPRRTVDGARTKFSEQASVKWRKKSVEKKKVFERTQQAACTFTKRLLRRIVVPVAVLICIIVDAGAHQS